MSKSKDLSSLQAAARLLERSGADSFEVFYERRTKTSIDSKDLKTESLSRAVDVGLALRVLKDQRMGFSFTTSLEPAAIERAVASALEVASVMPQDEHQKFVSFSEHVYPEFDHVDETGLSRPIEEKIELAKKLEETCKKLDPRIKTVRAATLSETDVERALLDASGETLHVRRSLFAASLSCKAEGPDGDSQMGGDQMIASELSLLDLGLVAKNAVETATELLGAKLGPTLKCPAIFRNAVVADLIDFLASSFSAENVEKRRSLLMGKIGERVFSESFSLTDDALVAEGPASQPFDGEGTPCGRTVLVDNGFVSTLLTDTYYARKLKLKPTGHATRGLKSPPSISSTNLIMTPGRRSLSELQSGISRGILITDLMGLHTANPVTGEFSLGASGILIEGGRLTRPVRGIAVAGNVLELLRRIRDTGSDLKYFGSVATPSILVEELAVSGA